MSQRTFCDICGDEVEAVGSNATRASGQVKGAVVRDGHQVTYQLLVTVDEPTNPAVQRDPPADCCQPCAINALLVGEGYLQAVRAKSEPVLIARGPDPAG